MSAVPAYPVRVQYADTDAGGIVHHAACLRWFEAARAEWLSQQGIEAAALMREQGLALAVSALRVAFRRPARLDDRLLIETRVLSRSRTAIELIQQASERGQIAVDSGFRLVCIDVQRGRPARLPAALLRVADQNPVNG